MSSSSLEDSYAAVLARRAVAEEERRKRAEQRRLARSVRLYFQFSLQISKFFRKKSGYAL